MQLDIAEIMTRLPIAIEERHYTRLSALASNAHEPSICEYLREEFERPRIVSPTSWNPDRQPGQQGRIPRRTLGKVHEIVLVQPSKADIAREQI